MLAVFGVGAMALFNENHVSSVLPAAVKDMMAFVCSSILLEDTQKSVRSIFCVRKTPGM